MGPSLPLERNLVAVVAGQVHPDYAVGSFPGALRQFSDFNFTYLAGFGRGTKGEIMIRMNQRVAVVVVALCLLWRSTAAGSEVRYILTDLGPGQANGLNNLGQVVGQNGAGHAMLYSGGTETDLGALPGGTGSFAQSINSSGQIVGDSNYGGYSVNHGFLYSNGHMQDLGTLGGNYSGGNGINDSGQIAGYAQDGNTYYHAAIDSGGSWQNLGIDFGAGASFGFCINNHGQVAGYSWINYDNNVAHAFLYSGGSAKNLGTLGGGASMAEGINNSGEVVGQSDTRNGAWCAFLYSNGSMQSLAPASAANGINDLGQIVGQNGGHAFILTDGLMQDLNDYLVEVDPDWTLADATGINDAGQICGYGIAPSGKQDGILLTPVVVPEPSSFALLAAGTIGLLGYGWRCRRAAKLARPVAFDQQGEPAILSFPSHTSAAGITN